MTNLPGQGWRPPATPFLAGAAGVLLAVLAADPAAALPGAFQSPWWENYEIRQSFLCPQRGLVVVERNDSQASVLSGGARLTLFRESGAATGLEYRNESLRLILKGDELTLEQLPQRLTCLRTEDA